MAKTLRETDLYPAVKSFLEGQGYEVKSEVGAADIMACREGDDPLIVELKTGFSLSLFHQGVARQTVTDCVYVAVPRGSGKRFQTSLKNNLSLCRRLGLGLITVRSSDDFVEVHCDPGSYRPRQSKARKTQLLREFAQRVGDPNKGGAQKVNLITAYRQDALACARLLQSEGAMKGAQVAKATGVPKATRLMADNHYGWFERVETGIYDLSSAGCAALETYAKVADRSEGQAGNSEGKE